MPRFYARICWNTKGWMAPSGDARKLESSTYAATNGFGHEEWLFNFTWLLDGYHYAFLQGVNNSWRNRQGLIVEVILWAIDARKRHVYIGKISNCEVLSEVESLKATVLHKQAGWLKLMREDLLAVEADSSKLSPTNLFNIRFRPVDAIQYDDPLPIANPDERISKLTRYKLVAALDSEPPPNLSRTRQGTSTAPSIGAHIRGGTESRIVDPYHPVLQRALMALLQKHFGYKSVVREEGWVDLTVVKGKRRILIEIKTDPVAKRAIREAMGQVMEYAFFPPARHHQNIDLFIVAPGPLDDAGIAYLALLKHRFGIPVRYCQFLPDGLLPNDFLR